MKLRTESGREIEIKFWHQLDKSMARWTECLARPLDFDTDLWGLAECHPSDNFNKARGRKLALKRAIASLPREERGQIWKAYFAAIGGVK